MRKNYPLLPLLVLLSAFTGTQQLPAQGVTAVTVNKYTYRPVVKNNRVLWFEYPQNTASVNLVKVYVYEKGSNRLVSDSATAFFTGWPDLDENGNVVYMKNIGGKSEVYLNDGKKETKISNNPAISPLPITMRRATDKIYTGYPRIARGDIVFRDAEGHIYLYQGRTKKIRKLTAQPAHTANLGDESDDKSASGVSVPLNAHIKYFEFDGRYITWMHQERQSGAHSKIFIYQLNIAETTGPKQIADFEAWVPNDKGILIGKMWNPFFRACNGKVIWQYYVPQAAARPGTSGLPGMIKDYGADLNDATVGFYDGNAAKVISNKTFVAPQSVRISDGKAIWWQTRKVQEGKNTLEYHEVKAYQNGGLSTVVSYPEAPKQANKLDRFWEGILDAEIIGDDVFWVMDQKECFQQFKMPVTNEFYCQYKRTEKVGFFLQSRGAQTPFNILSNTQYAGSGELDRNLYAFFSTGSNPLTRDIRFIRIPAGSNLYNDSSLITLIDRKTPDLVPWDTVTVLDAFTISNNSLKGCGSPDTISTLTLQSVTLDISAEKKPNARLRDIQSVALFVDQNENGEIDDDDRLVGRKIFPDTTFFKIIPGNPAIIINQGESKKFLVELLLKEDVCPCNRYRVSVIGENIHFRETTETPTGQSSGTAVLPAAIAEEELMKGDEQASLPGMELGGKLVLVYRNFPVRCGKAKFRITSIMGQSALLTGSSGRKDSIQLIQEFVQVGKDAHSAVSLRLGKKEGMYVVTGSIENPEGISCENEPFVFREHSGNMIVQIIDLNNPNYYFNSADNSNPDYSTWKSTMSTDLNQLSKGGFGREGAVADGASMLLVRLKLLGPEDAPPGDITLSLSGSGHPGHLSKGVGETIPNYEGGAMLKLKWTKIQGGIFAVGLYTPPLNYGDIPKKQREVKLTSTYTLPGATEPFEIESGIKLEKPPVALVHGFSSNPDTWGDHFRTKDPSFEKIPINYDTIAAGSFQLAGHVIKTAVSRIVKKYRNRKIAATRVNIIAHSMGGVLVRQHFRDNNGLNYHRKDNFGQGDVFKLISIGVPHHGSPLSWLSHTVQKTGAGAQFAALLKKVGMDLNAGGLAAMCPGSPQLLALGNTHIRTHAISTSIGKIEAGTSVWDYFTGQLKKIVDAVYNLDFDDAFFAALGMASFVNLLQWALTQVLNVSLLAFYSGDESDLLVTLTSQRAGIAQYKNFENVLHMSFEKPVKDFSGGWLSYSDLFQTTNGAIADHAYKTLNKDIDDINVFAKVIPTPTVQDPAITCK